MQKKKTRKIVQHMVMLKYLKQSKKNNKTKERRGNHCM